MVSITANYAANSALLALQSINRDLATTRNRVSTGMAVGSARDNGAIHSIAQRQASRLTELLAMQAGIDRATGAIDMSIAAGTSVLDKLLTMRDTAVAASDQSLSASDRAYLQADFDAMRSQINPMLAAAKFDGIDLVGSASGGFEMMLSGTSSSAAGPTVTRVSTSSAGGQGMGLQTTSIHNMQFFAGGTNLVFQSKQPIWSLEIVHSAKTCLLKT